MNISNIFKGVVSNVKDMGPGLQAVEVKSLVKKFNKETKQYEVIEVKHYVKNFKDNGPIAIGLEGFFYTSLEYRKFVSKKAINVETKQFFEYGQFDFILKKVFKTKVDLLKHMVNFFGNITQVETQAKEPKTETAAEILSKIMSKETKEPEAEKTYEGITLDDIFSE